MSEQYSKSSDLSQQLAELDWEIEPQRDLWPEISNQIDATVLAELPNKKSPPNWLPMAVAASLVLAVGSFMFSSMIDQQQQATQRYEAAMALYQQSQLKLIEQQHQMVRLQFANFLSQADSNVSPDFIIEAQALMNNIDKAAAEIKSAMSLQPNNPEYTSMLVTTYQQELKLLNKVKNKQGISI